MTDLHNKSAFRNSLGISHYNNLINDFESAKIDFFGHMYIFRGVGRYNPLNCLENTIFFKV